MPTYYKHDRHTPLDSVFINPNRAWSNVRVIHKFGRNAAVGTSFEAICIGGVYQMPQFASATTLRVKAGGDATDTAAGNGARTITLEGLDETGALVEETISTNGISAGTASTTTFSRLFRAFVATSGTYATTSAGSHADDIVIENGAGGTDWLTLDSSGGAEYPRGQSEIAAYTVGTGEEVYITSIHINVQSTKTAEVSLFKRGGADDASAPYEGMREQIQFGGVVGTAGLQPSTPLGPYPAYTDLVWMAKAATSAEVDVDFELIAVEV